MSIDIDKKTYKIEEKNYYHTTKNSKKQIILAGSNRKNNYHILRLQKKDRGNHKTWPTFTISRNGTIYQHFDPKRYSDYMGDKGIDKKSISIVLENMGTLTYNQEIDRYVNAFNEECDDELVYEKKWKNYIYWESYTEEQFKSTVELCKFICESEKYDVDFDCTGYNVYNDRTLTFRGIVTRSNYNQDFTDLNPSFNFKRFLDEMEIEI